MKRKPQQHSPKKSDRKRIGLWILLILGGILVGGGIVLALFLWFISSLPFM